MLKGILIYGKDDYEKNKWFADRIITVSKRHKILINCILTSDLLLGVDNNGLCSYINKNKISTPDFVINRSRNFFIGNHFELMGSILFNSSRVTEISNNKSLTHQFINCHGIKSVNTLFCNKKNFCIDNINLTPPLVLKSVSGHGGTSVFKVNFLRDLYIYLNKIDENDFILQEMSSNPGNDIRVFVIGNKIIASVKRYSTKNFKSNFSLGGKSEAYYLSYDEKKIVNQIIKLFDFDFVGIDFILNKSGELLFNEIEDVVGTRTLYKNYDIDIVEVFVEYIKNKLKILKGSKF